MPTFTEEATVVICQVPAPLYEVAKQESELFSPLIRKALRWHRGEGPRRHPDLPPVELPDIPNGKTKRKSAAISEDDVNHLDAMCATIGCSRGLGLVIILNQWLGLPIFSPDGSCRSCDSW